MFFKYKHKKLFLASSAELADDIVGFTVCINNFNAIQNKWKKIIEVYSWRDFITALSDKRTQDDYNTFIRNSDIVVILFHTKIGSFTFEEYETAISAYSSKRRPLVYVYFKEDGSSQDETIQLFKEKIGKQGLFYGTYTDYNDLNSKFAYELQKLSRIGFFSKITSIVSNIVVSVITVIVIGFLFFIWSEHNVKVSFNLLTPSSHLKFSSGIVQLNKKTIEISEIDNPIIFTEIQGLQLLKPLVIHFEAVGFQTLDSIFYYNKDVTLNIAREDSAYGYTSGYVIDFANRMPIANAHITIENNYHVNTDSNGYFKYFIPLKKQKPFYSICINKYGYSQFYDTQMTIAGKDTKFYPLNKNIK